MWSLPPRSLSPPERARVTVEARRTIFENAEQYLEYLGHDQHGKQHRRLHSHHVHRAGGGAAQHPFPYLPTATAHVPRAIRKAKKGSTAHGERRLGLCEHRQ